MKILKYLGEFNYPSFSLIGKFSKRLILAIYTDIFKNVNTSNLILDNKNEKIENDTYFLFINATISSSCDEGQYHDSNKYFSLILID